MKKKQAGHCPATSRFNLAEDRREEQDDIGTGAEHSAEPFPTPGPEPPAVTLLGRAPPKPCTQESSLPVLDGVAEVSARDLWGPARH